MMTFSWAARRLGGSATRRKAVAAVFGAAVVLIAACTEPRRSEQAKPAPSMPPEARLEVSDSLAAPGSEIDVTVRVVGARVGSMTARLAYDSTALRFVRELSLDDGATRVSNPQAGLVRFAAIAQNGFADGKVYSLHFALLRAGGARSFQLSTDELHSVAQADLRPALMRKP